MTNDQHKSALNVQKGIDQPSQINDSLVGHLKKRRLKDLTTEEYVGGILSGNRTILSKAITLIESSLPAHQEKAQEIIGKCLQFPVPSSQFPVSSSPVTRHASHVTIRIGITGVPGVGKSTFIEALGKHLTADGHKLAVLAIDPSSSRSKGSILGDKTRMEELGVDPNAYIRPSPAAGSLGGVARKTRETIILCEAAGFDVIFVETVGVGQSETAVHSMVDFFLLLMLAGAGDELQGIKRGIIEMADAIVINKADGDNIGKAKLAKAQYENALHLFPPSESGWRPPVGTCSSKTKEGINSVWKVITDYQDHTLRSGYFHHKRSVQDRQVMFESIEEALKSKFFSRKEIQQLIQKLEAGVLSHKINPYVAAQEVMKRVTK
ncbi:MAG: methylmalonyl Co-A mutase-associated GTPase MeaB [Bacteroidetes bacterium]|nr:methylmalonyl Co-A mutase-associated GTPase MeaB [Bacteroidota bacterium]